MLSYYGKGLWTNCLIYDNDDSDDSDDDNDDHMMIMMIMVMMMIVMSEMTLRTLYTVLFSLQLFYDDDFEWLQYIYLKNEVFFEVKLGNTSMYSIDL